MKILFTGGGTLGPVTPLLAVAETWKANDASVVFVWVGTKDGPERELVEKMHIPFFSTITFKFPRYFTFEWFLLPIKAIIAFLNAFLILQKEKPDVIASASGFTSVPFVIVGRLLGVPSWIHQQDAVPVLAMKVMTPFATKITVAWYQLLDFFPVQKTVYIGNPIRLFLTKGDKDRAMQELHLDQKKPTVLVLGGGSGSAWINKQLLLIGAELSKKANVIHVTGRGKGDERLKEVAENYFVTELFVDGLADALAAADLVVTRAGMGAVTECAALKKACIFIPLPHSPQENNVEQLSQAGAALVLTQSQITANDLQKTIISLLNDEAEQKKLSSKISGLLPTDVAGDLIEIIKTIK